MSALTSLLDALTRLWPRPDALTLGSVVFLVAVTAVIELTTSGSARRHFSRNAWTDVLYTAFYLCGFYTVFVSAPISHGLTWVVDTYVPAARLGLARGLPVATQAALLIILGDFVRYWVHRWTHVNPWLWQFHKIHHAQDVLTAWTSFRSHFVDFALLTLSFYGLSLLFGPSPAVWAPVSILLIWQSLVIHTGFDWSFGPLDRLIVSPRFHNVHHSLERRHFDRNFATLFSVWDRVFGTSDTTSPRPVAFGLPGPRIPESFWRQLVWPFRAVARLRQRPS